MNTNKILRIKTCCTKKIFKQQQSWEVESAKRDTQKHKELKDVASLQFQKNLKLIKKKL